MLLDGIATFLTLGVTQALLGICSWWVGWREMARDGRGSLLITGYQPKEESTVKLTWAVISFLFFQILKYPLCKEREVTPPYIAFLKFPSKSSHQKREQERTQGVKQILTKWHLFTSRIKTRIRQTAWAQGPAQAPLHFHVAESQEPSALLSPPLSAS